MVDADLGANSAGSDLNAFVAVDAASTAPDPDIAGQIVVAAAAAVIVVSVYSGFLLLVSPVAPLSPTAFSEAQPAPPILGNPDTSHQSPDGTYR